MTENNVPKHVAIIMDGNRRWAKKRGLASIAGHARASDETVENLIEYAGEIGVEYLTLWAFSTENWGREKDEVEGVMNLFRKALMTKVQKFIEKGARLMMIGDISKFDPDIREGIEKAIKESEKNAKITVVFALNYGGRDEIERAVNRMIQGRKSSNHSPKITQGSELESHLDTAGMPEPDLIIRTGGEKRLSGFLLWQSAYSELIFVDTLFPDFGKEEFESAIEEYRGRQRRFGR